jgi:hypothetical protein
MSEEKARGGWSQLSAAAKQERIERMLEARARNKAKKTQGAGKRLPQVVEVETIRVPAPRANGAAPEDDLDALASLIIAIWRRL